MKVTCHLGKFSLDFVEDFILGIQIMMCSKSVCRSQNRHKYTPAFLRYLVYAKIDKVFDFII